MPYGPGGGGSGGASLVPAVQTYTGLTLGIAATAVAGTWAPQIQTGDNAYTSFYNFSAALNDEWTIPLTLTQGTWTLYVYYGKGSNFGIGTFTLGATVLGTVDGYASSTAFNQTHAFTGISVVSDSTFTLDVKVTSKDGSSSAYGFRTSSLVAVKTA